MNKKYIIWDWNGTLLNDVDYCVDCMNKVLAKHKLPSINTEIYKEKFTFPVKDYYAAIGFDFGKTDFEVPAMQFIEEYYSGVENISLHQNVVDILEYFNSVGTVQFCLSAMEHSNLIDLLSKNNLDKYFESISGIDNHYAHSKIEFGEKMISEFGDDKKSEFVLIGDTIHDHEVASHLGIDCILVSNGHQNTDRLRTVSNNIISDLSELKSIIN